jgi:peptide/nickel transport system substrate-binding protein
MALNLAIDREAIAEAMFLGYASPLGQPFAPGGALTPTIDLQYEYDPETAEQLLADAGYGDGLTLNMQANTSSNSDLLSLVASYFAEIGVTVEIELIEAATYNDGWVAGQFDHLRYASWSNPEQALELLIRTDDLISSYANPDADALVDQQAVQVVPEERKSTIDELAQLMHDDAAWVFLWSTDAIVGVAPGVTGWEPRASFVPVTNVTVSE